MSKDSLYAHYKGWHSILRTGTIDTRQMKAVMKAYIVGATKCKACKETFAKRDLAESHVLEQHFLMNVVKCLPCDAAFGMSDIQGHFEEKHFGAKNSATMAMRAKESVLDNLLKKRARATPGKETILLKKLPPGISLNIASWSRKTVQSLSTVDTISKNNRRTMSLSGPVDVSWKLHPGMSKSQFGAKSPNSGRGPKKIILGQSWLGSHIDCSECSKTFPNVKTLRQHKTAVHSNKRALNKKQGMGRNNSKTKSVPINGTDFDNMPKARVVIKRLTTEDCASYLKPNTAQRVMGQIAPRNQRQRSSTSTKTNSVTKGQLRRISSNYPGLSIQKQPNSRTPKIPTTPKDPLAMARSKTRRKSAPMPNAILGNLLNNPTLSVSMVQ